MSLYKDVLISLIVLSVLNQISAMLLHKTSFLNIFKTVSGILLLVSIMSVFSSCRTDLNIHKEHQTDITFHDENIIETEFKKKLNTIIQYDLHNIYYVNPSVRVNTDMKKLTIYVSGQFETKVAEDIKNYVLKKYCTSNDEVILINESA